jgi:chromosome segregation ATPase
MPPLKKRATDHYAVSDSTVTLNIEEAYLLPTFYEHAPSSEVGRALTLGATLLEGGVPPTLNTQVEIATAVNQIKQECLKRQEDQLRTHEATLATIASSHASQLETQRSTMQAELERMKGEHAQNNEKINDLINQCDGLDSKVTQYEEKGAVLSSDFNQEAIKGHFEALANHTGELLSAMAEHARLVKRLDKSATKLRAKMYLYYRDAKALNVATPWLGATMELPFDAAFSHALSRKWNDVTKSKADDILDGLGKDAFDLCKKAIAGGKGE